MVLYERVRDMSVIYPNQESPEKVSKKIIKGKRYNSYIDIVKKNCPDITSKEVIKMFEELNHGGCSCAAFANAIYKEFYTSDDDFYNNFGFSLEDSKGNVDINILMVDIYSRLYNASKVKLVKYNDYAFNNYNDAFDKLLGKEFEKESDGIVAFFNRGYLSNGTDTLGNIIIHDTKPIVNNYIGTPGEIAKAAFGINNIKTLDELESICKEKKINITVSDKTIAAKLTGLLANNFNFWNKYYFDSYNLDFSLEKKEIAISELDNDYDMLKDKLLTLSNNGTIYVSAGPGKDARMHTNKALSWSRIGSDTAGHVMTFTGFDKNGDILVNSYGEEYIIPKEYYADLSYYVINRIGIDEYKKETIK